MSLRLALLDQDSAYEHLFERYSLLQANASQLQQDLGIISRAAETLELSFDPVESSHTKDSFSLTLSQSLTGLNSSANNNNSTTGYVAWSTTPFFLRWLLYSQSGSCFTQGANLKMEDGSYLQIPPMFSTRKEHDFYYILELGSGVAGILSTVLANYVEKFVCTDQKALLSGLKRNITDNIDEIYLRNVESTTLGSCTTRKTTSKVLFDIVSLDWETFKPDAGKVDSLLLPSRSGTIYILAMDVVYNDFLIDPFLKTLHGLMSLYSRLGNTVRSIIGIQLRDQDILQEFLDQAVDKYGLRIYAVLDPEIYSSRFAFYYISL
ncbi:LAFE_0H07690g1_1 [Lachancea fermentati]|uniref:Ribosomal lysine N-methyltransferase 5 n=1 Tax=Lachancea fermentati TaxID=4955 RepID=A0A1G4MJX9_LACFM|nr:LAFE_0H07690g1_1 [Lachancea fermentati]